MIPEEAKYLLARMKDVEWLAFENEKYVEDRRKNKKYLEVTLIDDMITKDTLRAVLDTAYLKLMDVFMFIRNNKFVVRFELHA